MAPITLNPSLFDISVSSLELDRRTSPAQLPSHIFSFSPSDRHEPDASHTFAKRSAFDSPLTAASILRARDPAPNSQYNPGSAAIPPTSINNKGVFILFGLLSASLVLASIWFFFQAKNGGFHFRKRDWDDYKSTVLRRKGPDGKTLSNATKSTELGGGSIVAETDRSTYFAPSVAEREKPRRDKRGKKKQNKNSHDNDVRAYRQEKPAKVGGLNREADGSYHDYTTTDPSEVSHPLAHKNKKNKEKEAAPVTPIPAKEKRSRQFSYAPGTESTFSVYSDDSHRPLRATTHHHHSNSRDSTPARTPTRSRQSSPAKGHSTHTPTHKPRYSASQANTRSSTHDSSYVDPIDFQSRYAPAASEAATDETRGTKAYFHPLPGLSTSGKANGFRRGGGRRRDSLSDSDGETGTVRS